MELENWKWGLYNKKKVLENWKLDNGDWKTGQLEMGNWNTGKGNYVANWKGIFCSQLATRALIAGLCLAARPSTGAATVDRGRVGAGSCSTPGAGPAGDGAGAPAAPARPLAVDRDGGGS